MIGMPSVRMVQPMALAATVMSGLCQATRGLSSAENVGQWLRGRDNGRFTVLGECSVEITVDAVVAVEVDVVGDFLGAGVAVVDKSLVEGEVKRVVDHAASVQDGLIGVGVWAAVSSFSRSMVMDDSYSLDRCCLARQLLVGMIVCYIERSIPRPSSKRQRHHKMEALTLYQRP